MFEDDLKAILSIVGPFGVVIFLTAVPECGVSSSETGSHGTYIYNLEALRFFLDYWSMQTAEEINSMNFIKVYNCFLPLGKCF